LAWKCLSAFTADTTSQLDVLGHDRHSLGVDGAQVGSKVKGQTARDKSGRELEAVEMSLEIGRRLLANVNWRSVPQPDCTWKVICSYELICRPDVPGAPTRSIF